MKDLVDLKNSHQRLLFVACAGDGFTKLSRQWQERLELGEKIIGLYSALKAR